MIGCIIQARMGSSRLPGKVMMKVNDESKVIDFVINQIKDSGLINEIIVATSNLVEDNKIVEHLKKNNIKFFLGSPTDLLDRYFKCAKKFSVSIIVRITGDNPLVDPRIIDSVIEKFRNNDYDYVTNSLVGTFPYGTEVEVFSFNALKIAWENAKLPSEREHVTPFMKKHPEIFRILNIENKENLSHLRYTVDHQNDLELIREVIKNIKSRPIFIEDIIELFKRKPDLIKMNESNIRDEGYLKSLKEDEKFLKLKSNDEL